MFVRGVDQPIEYGRVDNSFYKGIVVRNDDPLQMYRVKIYIPELSNQPYKNWLESKHQFELKFPGHTNPSDTWTDDVTFKEITKFLPWAEASFPLMGEGGSGYYHPASVISRTTHITDSTHLREQLNDYAPNDDEYAIFAGAPCDPIWIYGVNDNRTELKPGEKYVGYRGPYINEGFDQLKPMSIANGCFSPSYFYEAYETMVCDHFTNAIGSLKTQANPYAYEYRPATYVNKPKGVFGVPNVGTKVWVFHYNGDVNLPVYFGIRHDYREALMMNDQDIEPTSLDYPGYYENEHPFIFKDSDPLGEDLQTTLR